MVSASLRLAQSAAVVDISYQLRYAKCSRELLMQPDRFKEDPVRCSFRAEDGRGLAHEDSSQSNDDVIVSINGKNVLFCSVQEILDLVKKIDGDLTLQLLPFIPLGPCDPAPKSMGPAQEPTMLAQEQSETVLEPGPREPTTEPCEPARQYSTPPPAVFDLEHCEPVTSPDSPMVDEWGFVRNEAAFMCPLCQMARCDRPPSEDGEESAPWFDDSTPPQLCLQHQYRTAPAGAPAVAARIQAWTTFLGQVNERAHEDVFALPNDPNLARCSLFHAPHYRLEENDEFLVSHLVAIC